MLRHRPSEFTRRQQAGLVARAPGRQLSGGNPGDLFTFSGSTTGTGQTAGNSTR